MRRLTQGGERESAPAARGDSRESGELQFLVFRLGDDEFALPIEAVDEVGEMPAKITKLPKTPKFLEGVVNLRGDVLRSSISADGSTCRRSTNPIGAASWLCARSSTVRGSLSTASPTCCASARGSVEAPPDLTDQVARLVRGVINLEETQRIVLVLDPSELLTPAERGRLDAFQKTSRANA